uniref:F-box domain-containing protein n=1 Tax=Moniliophthora roreri TaxID=221103 RepID=A0A0W0GDP4_MONRR
MPSLPPELIPPILAEFPEDSKALRKCALVCQSWVRISRSISFRTLRVTGSGLSKKRRARRVARFLHLCASPLETFSKSNIHHLELHEWPHSPYDFDPTGQHLEINALLEWHSADGTRNFSSLFPFLKRLSFVGDISWRSLSRKTREVLHEGFTTVTELKLGYIYIDVEAFLPLIHSFPSLQSLELDFLRHISAPVSEPNTLAIERPHPTLERIILQDVTNVNFIRSLHEFPRIKVLYLEGSILLDALLESEELQSSITQLIHSARSTLEEFRCQSYFDDPMEIDAFLAWLDVTELNKLRRIELDFDPYVESTDFPSSFPDFFDKLSTSNNIFPSQLEVLSIPFLPQHTCNTDFQKLDDILQRPYFSSVRELKCNFTCNFTRNDVMKQYRRRKRWYLRPDEDSAAELDLQERIRDFRVTYLPKCEARGILTTGHNYYYKPPLR